MVGSDGRGGGPFKERRGGGRNLPSREKLKTSREGEKGELFPSS